MSCLSFLQLSLVEFMLGLEFLLETSNLLGRLLEIGLSLYQILFNSIEGYLVHVILFSRCTTSVETIPLNLCLKVFMDQLQLSLEYDHLLLQVFNELLLLLHQLRI